MKRISTVLAVLMLVALVTGNVVGRTPTPSDIVSAKRLHSFVNYSLAESGLSVSPDEVVIGADGWMYLGDLYSGTISSHRPPTNSEMVVDQAESLLGSLDEWSVRLSGEGVGFFFLVGPNKSSIYPEFLPGWAEWDNTSSMAIFVKALGEKPPLVLPHNALRRESELLLTYYLTDSHWNDWGGYVGYRELMNEVVNQNDSLSPNVLEFEPDQFIEKSTTVGDLAWLLSFGEFGSDTNSVLIEPLAIPVTESDWATGEIFYEGPVRSLAPPQDWTLIQSPDALNSMRVLWLRDSFGDEMSSYMHATFEETLTIHFEETDSEDVLARISDFEPDLVLVTHVERNLPGSTFMPGNEMSLTVGE